MKMESGSEVVFSQVASKWGSGDVAQILNPMPLGIKSLSPFQCPGGTGENSPAFQRWVRTSRSISPEGTTEGGRVRPSLRDLSRRDLQPSVETPGYSRLSLRDKNQHLVHILVALDVKSALRLRLAGAG